MCSRDASTIPRPARAYLAIGRPATSAARSNTTRLVNIMIRKWHDISVALDGDLPTWPGSPGVRTQLRTSMGEGDDANVTQLSIDVHTGTHIDAPRHFVDHGKTVEELGLDPFIGSALVLDTGSAKE